MHIVHVHVRVKPGCEAAFLAASLENARNSIQEPGIARFDVFQEAADLSRFVFIEVFRDAEAPALHKKTAHYAAWRVAVDEMMAEPRRGVEYFGHFPANGDW